MHKRVRIRNGSVVGAGQSGGWTPIAVEQTATGYEVAWKVPGTDQYSIWTADGAGNFAGNSVGVLGAASITLQSYELSFHQDLNGDGHIGLIIRRGNASWTPRTCGRNVLPPPGSPTSSKGRLLTVRGR